MKTIDVTTNETLADLEKKITEIRSLKNGESLIFRMSRNTSQRPFVSSRLAALFATAQSQQIQIIIVDWHNVWESKDAYKVFRNTLGGLAAASYGTQFCNTANIPPPFDVKSIIVDVAMSGGMLELESEETDVGRSLTYCSFDPKYPEPAILTGLIYNKKDFSSHFVSRLRKHFEKEEEHESEDLFGIKPEFTLADYIFELYQNGYEHGRYAKSKREIISGLRFVFIRKHIVHNEKHLPPLAKDFPELEEYLARRYELSKGLKYYEVAISDQGLGMLERFLADCKDEYEGQLTKDKCLELLQGLLIGKLTSKTNSPSAGKGLRQAIFATKKLNGFLSIRTDRFWLYCSFPDNSAQPIEELKEVKYQGVLPMIAGTHLNAIFPLQIAT